MSQPTQCATLGSGEGRRPFEPLAAGRARPPLPVVVQLVADFLHPAIVVAYGDAAPRPFAGKSSSILSLVGP